MLSGRLSRRPAWPRSSPRLRWVRTVPAPLAAFAVIYLATCYVGAMALLAGPRWVREWYVYLSGAQMPELGAREILLVLALLHLAPAALVLGWWLGGRVEARLPQRARPTVRVASPSVRALAILVAGAIAYLIVRLAIAGAVASPGSWLSYDAFIERRGEVVGGLGFVDFVLVYSVLPLLVGGLLARILATGELATRRGRAGALVAVVAMAVVNLALFQKRSLLVSLAIVAAVVYFAPGSGAIVRSALGRARSRAVPLAAAGASVYVLYLVLLVAPVVSNVDDPAPPDPAVVLDANFNAGTSGWGSAGAFVVDGARLEPGAGRSGRGLEVTTARALEGATYPTGATAEAGSRWELSVSIRAPRTERVALLVGRDRFDSAVGTVRATPAWRTERITWTPANDIESIAVALRAGSAGRFDVDDVRLRRLEPLPDRRAVLESTFDSSTGGWATAGPFLLAGARAAAGDGDSGGGLEVSASRPLQGAVHPTGADAERRRAWDVSMQLRADEPGQVQILVGRDRVDTSVGTFDVDRQWRRYDLNWLPRRDVRNVQVAVRTVSGSSFVVDDVEVLPPPDRVAERDLVLSTDFDGTRHRLDTAGSFLNAGATLSPDDGVTGRGLEVRTDGPLQGVQQPSGTPAPAGSIWELSAWVRSDSSTPVSLLAGGGRSEASVSTVAAGPVWRRLVLTWRPTRRVANPQVAIRANESGKFVIDDLSFRRVRTERDLLVSSDFETGRGGWATAGEFVVAGARSRRSEGRSGRGLAVTTRRELQGISYATGATAREGSDWLASAYVRADRPARITLAVGRDAADPGIGTSRATPNWTRLEVPWTSSQTVRDVQLALRTAGPAEFEVDDVQLRRASGPEQSDGGPPPRLPGGTITLPIAATGPDFPEAGTLEPRSRGATLFFYALLGPFTRTSGPAVAYPAIYPDEHAYYPIDLGLDRIGIGRAPDDNVTSFEALFPDTGSGTNAVPFQFAFYSQGGLVVALVGALLLGLFWRLIWTATRSLATTSLEGAGLAALTVIYGVIVAGDAARNAALSSYGLVWPALLLVVVLTARHLRARRSS